MNSLAQQLLDISDSLTPDNWTKGNYFDEKGRDIVCMCAHGAVQAACNPQVRQALSDYYLGTGTIQAVRAIAVRALAADAAAEAACTPTSCVRKLWESRPEWIRKDYFDIDHLLFGNRDLHYLLGMVGLTAEFNDRPSTTLPMIKAKFQEAAELARRLGI